MSLRHVLLGLLNQDRASGYQLARRFDRTLWRYAWHAQYSQIYPELYRMAALGLITVVAGGPRHRRVYSITQAGQAELRQWLHNPPGQIVVRSEFVVRLFLLSSLDPSDARRLLAPTADETVRELATLRTTAANAEVAVPGGAPLPFDRLATEFAVRSVEALHQWALWALSELDRAED
jgi:DNA-binding PadR family transcriptional regulator